MSQVSPQEADVLLHENRFLKQTILSLRDELVKKDYETDKLLQARTTHYEKEVSHLKTAVEEQRSALDLKISEHEDEKQAIKKVSRLDQQELKKILKDLRLSLEKVKGESEEKILRRRASHAQFLRAP